MVDTKNVSLYDIAKRYQNEGTRVIGDSRHPQWQRFLMIAISGLLKNPIYRQYGMELSKMVKSNALNGEVLNLIVEDMEDGELSQVDETSLEIVAAVRNTL